MKRFILFALVGLISLPFCVLADAATVSQWQLFGTVKVKGHRQVLGGGDTVRLESDGTVSVSNRNLGSLITWSQSEKKLNLNPNKVAINALLSTSDFFQDLLSRMGYASGNVTVKSIVASGKFLSDSVIEGFIRTTLTTTINGQAIDIPVSIVFMGIQCKTGSISGRIDPPLCGCVEARNLATDEGCNLGCTFGGGRYGKKVRECTDGLPPGNYEVCLDNFCGPPFFICKTVTVGENEDVTVNFP